VKNTTGSLFRDYEGILCLDLQSYTYQEAKQVLQQTLNSFNRGNELKVIHGYRGGSTLKTMVWNFNHPKIVDREPGDNPGETIYYLG